MTRLSGTAASLSASEPSPGWDCHVHVFDSAAAVQPGHYRPAHRPLAQVEAEAAALGVGHLVLVQPSVYGSDNTLLLAALAEAPGRHRGVVVLADDVAPAQLDAMASLGVCGARLNCVSPVGEAADLSASFARLAPLLRPRGWHLQWYAQAGQLAQIAELHQGSGLVCVLDHLAGLHAGLAHDDPAWGALARLAAQGAWVKLSGWYRLGAVEPYEALQPTIRRVAALFSERLVWGSDWPHTLFAPGREPAYASTWAPVAAALGEATARALRDAPPAIYRAG
ncbi:MAG: amidohydrolase family protein [Ideonella sp.]|nr:amidohydrolase family protein [Ideonella sp.]